MATVVSMVPYKFLPPKIGGQKSIALFNQFFSHYQKLICLTVVDNDNTYAKGYDTIKIFLASRLRYINPATFFTIKKILKQKQATHLQIEHPYMGWLAFLLVKATGVKWIVHSHNIESMRFKTLGKSWWRLLWYYERWVHRRADYNFFIHEADRRYAIEQYGLQPEKCIVVTYGINLKEPPSAADIQRSQQWLREKYSIANNEKILLFTGSFDYKPNIDALKVIEQQIAPLLDASSFSYKILVCGPWLEASFMPHSKIIITGFVDSIEPYFKGADVFLNPVIEGGGIKTKLVEALGYNCNAVSTYDGATGVDAALCNDKLLITPNGDWGAFAQKVIEAAHYTADIPPAFYQHFYWGYSTKKAAEFIEEKR